MYKIDENQNIVLTRSDTCILKLEITDSAGNSYDYSNDTVQLTVKSSTYTNDIIIQKTIDGDSFVITPDDTKDLTYDVYMYDVQIITPQNNVYTVIGPCDFVLSSEVNFNVTR